MKTVKQKTLILNLGLLASVGLTAHAEQGNLVGTLKKEQATVKNNIKPMAQVQEVVPQKIDTKQQVNIQLNKALEEQIIAKDEASQPAMRTVTPKQAVNIQLQKPQEEIIPTSKSTAASSVPVAPPFAKAPVAPVAPPVAPAQVKRPGNIVPPVRGDLLKAIQAVRKDDGREGKMGAQVETPAVQPEVRSMVPVTPAVKPSGNLLGEIQQGKQLRSVSEQKPIAEKPKTAEQLRKEALEKRRIAMAGNVSDAESDEEPEDFD